MHVFGREMDDFIGAYKILDSVVVMNVVLMAMAWKDVAPRNVTFVNPDHLDWMFMNFPQL
jgi:hypothetical protein